MQAQQSLGEIIRVFGSIGLLSFGGPAAQIALMHRILVDERKWLEDREFLSALSFCMLLPGPEAMQLATFAGWKLRGVAGGLIAGLLFILPGAVVIAGFGWAYVHFGGVAAFEAAFLGVKAAVVAIVIEALLKVSRRALTGPGALAIAALAFCGIFLFSLPFPLIVGIAAGIGALVSAGETTGASPPPKALATGRTVAIWSALWLGPLALLWRFEAGILAEIGAFFARLAVVTFGGAYAVLAYMAQEVVEDRGWLTAAQMVDGLGLAETTPGPLILVTEFVGFLAGHGAGGMPIAFAAVVVTLWATFVPCFLWIFAGAPYLDWIVARPRLKGALSAITAAVVGVILNLSLWFGAHVLFHTVSPLSLGPIQTIRPELSSLDPEALGLAIFAALTLFGLRWPLLRVLCLSALAGLAVWLFQRF